MKKASLGIVGSWDNRVALSALPTMFNYRSNAFASDPYSLSKYLCRLKAEQGEETEEDESMQVPSIFD